MDTNTYYFCCLIRKAGATNNDDELHLEGGLTEEQAEKKAHDHDFHFEMLEESLGRELSMEEYLANYDSYSHIKIGPEYEPEEHEPTLDEHPHHGC